MAASGAWRENKGVTRRPGKWLSWKAKALAGVEAFVGVGAVPMAGGLLTDTTGRNVGLTVEMLKRGPFADYLVPGIVLLTVIGGSSLAAAGAVLLRKRWAPQASVLAGVLLMGWIAVQVAVMGPVHWLQPLFFGLGVAMAVLGWVVRTEE